MEPLENVNLKIIYETEKTLRQNTRPKSSSGAITEPVRPTLRATGSMTVKGTLLVLSLITPLYAATPHSDLRVLARLLALSGSPLTKPRGERREYSLTGSPDLGPNQTSGSWIAALTLWTEKEHEFKLHSTQWVRRTFSSIIHHIRGLGRQSAEYTPGKHKDLPGV